MHRQLGQFDVGGNTFGFHQDLLHGRSGGIVNDLGASADGLLDQRTNPQ